jgi:hypothetical protein
MPGFDPAIMEYPRIVQNLSDHDQRMTSGCVKAYGRNPGELVYVVMEPPYMKPYLPYESLPFDLYTDVRKVVQTPATYTWLLFMDGMFAAAKTLTRYELRSKHYDIFGEFRKPVVAAGEVRVNPGGLVEYNFNSGTFMKELMEREHIMSYEKYNEYLTNMFRAAGATGVMYAPGSDLTFEVIATPETLKRYSDIGYSLLTFKTRGDCDRYRFRNYSRALNIHNYFDEENESNNNMAVSGGGKRRGQTRRRRARH